MDEYPTPNLRFNLREWAGAIGDYGTLVPIIVGVAAVTNMQLAPILFFSDYSTFTGLIAFFVNIIAGFAIMIIVHLLTRKLFNQGTKPLCKR